MRYIAFALATASLASAQTGISSSAAATPTPIGAVVQLGQPCTPGGTMCALGAQCYAVNSMQIPVCGNFQAGCTSNQQCAFNTCNNGFCNGMTSSSMSTPVASPTPSPIGAVVQLGQPCTPGGTMCALGAQCYATNSGLQTICGNFQAGCTSNQQCAFNTCNNGFCNGLLPSSAMSSRPASASTTVRPSSLMSSIRSMSGNGTAPASRTPTPGSQTSGASTPAPVNPSRTGGASSATGSSPAVFTGAAAVVDVAGGAMAVVLGAVAFAL